MSSPYLKMLRFFGGLRGAWLIPDFTGVLPVRTLDDHPTTAVRQGHRKSAMGLAIG